MKKLTVFLCMCVMALACARAQALPDGEWAVVNASAAYMRAEARYSSECVSQTRMGTLVRVLERKGYWVRVATPEPYDGWINELALAPVLALSAERQRALQEWSPKLVPLSSRQAAEYLRKPKYICTAEYTHVFAEPSENSERVCDLLMSDIILKGNSAKAVSPEASACCSGKACDGQWVAVQTPQGVPGWVRAAEIADFREFAGSVPASPEVSAQAVISLAKQFLGVPYFWGGMSVKGFDCSGLVGLCYFMNGILLPRDASEQILCGEVVDSLEDALPGDLIFFGNTTAGHVAIYIGDGRIVHSSQTVRINSLRAGDPDYYGRPILGIRRFIGNDSKIEKLADSNMYFAD